MRYGSSALIQANNYMMLVKYVVFMLIFFIAFIATSVILLPLAWIIGTIDKISNQSHERMYTKIREIILFIFAGPFILVADIMADILYFWKYNFRSDLNRIVIAQEKSTIKNKTLREVSLRCFQFAESKIKAVTTTQLIRIFRHQFKVQAHIQFLLFGQFVPKGGFKTVDQRKQMTLKSMKTEKLIEERENELLLMNDDQQLNISKEIIQQFNQIKKLLHCITYKVNEKKVLCTNIIIHIMNEMRQDRKIKMVLKDRGIEEYVSMDITDIDIQDPEEVEEQPEEV